MVPLPFRAAGLLLALAIVPYVRPGLNRPRITILSGSRPDGTATELWLAILRPRLAAASYDSVARIRRVRTFEEEEWANLIRSRAATWPAAADTVASLFDIPPAQEVRVVLGDRGGEDAFTHDSLTMAFDLAALQRVYGSAAQPGNQDRMDRFFRHEFVHLLQKRWLALHPVLPHSPVEEAILDAWAEGLGNYYSLSESWRPNGVTPSPVTQRVLAELEPRFVARMTGLACADSASARQLLADLSSGPFTQKWGALPVALWLLADQTSNPEALRTFARAGPTAVWELARRHLHPPLGDSLDALRRQGRRCPPQDSRDAIHPP